MRWGRLSLHTPKRKSRSKYLRKNRKWPHSPPYKTRWQDCFSQQLLKLAEPQDNILNTLKHSFHIHNCNPTLHSYHFTQNIPEILDHLQSSQHSETPEFLFVDLIKAYGQLGMFGNAVRLFYRIPMFRCVPTVCSLNALLSVLCRSKQGIVLVPDVIVKSQGMGIRVEESSFRILISALCRINLVGSAIQILRCVMNDGCDVHLKVCSLILSALCKIDTDVSVDSVLRVFGEMRVLGFCPGRVDYANLIRLLVKSGRGMDALDMLERMKGDGIKPDIFCYTMVLDGMVECEKFDKAEILFDELLVFGLVPDIYTYSVYVKGLCKQAKFDEGFKMVEYMDSLGCKPNLVTYNILLDGLCKVGELERAKKVFTEMGSKDVELNLQTYKIMLNGLIREGQIIESYNLSNEMLAKYTNFRCSQFDEVLCELCEMDMISMALELLGKMVNKNVAPGQKSWRSLLLSSVTNLSMTEVTMARLLDSV